MGGYNSGRYGVRGVMEHRKLIFGAAESKAAPCRLEWLVPMDIGWRSLSGHSVTPFTMVRLRCVGANCYRRCEVVVIANTARFWAADDAYAYASTHRASTRQHGWRGALAPSTTG